jgi:hypothetical protein
MNRRLVSLSMAVGAWVATAWVMLGALTWGITLRCDDHCTSNGVEWRETEGAWQWNLVVALGVLAFAAGTMHVVLVWRRRGYLAIAALLAAAVAVLALSGLLA